MTTLSSVQSTLRESVLEAKVLLGTLITLMDDLADHPKYRDEELLARLYRIPAELLHELRPETAKDVSDFEHLVRTLFNELFAKILAFGERAEVFLPFFIFEIEQFFQANRYSALISELPYATNRFENRQIISYNMGIVAVGMLDLMVSPHFDLRELGLARELFIKTQLASRLMNVVMTADREQLEGDVTGELSGVSLENLPTAKADLSREIEQSLAQLQDLSEKISSFDGKDYVQSFRKLAELHRAHAGVL